MGKLLLEAKGGERTPNQSKQLEDEVLVGVEERGGIRDNRKKRRTKIVCGRRTRNHVTTFSLNKD